MQTAPLLDLARDKRRKSVSKQKQKKRQSKFRSTKKSKASPRYKYCLAGEVFEWHVALEVMSRLKNMTGYWNSVQSHTCSNNVLCTQNKLLTWFECDLSPVAAWLTSCLHHLIPAEHNNTLLCCLRGKTANKPSTSTVSIFYRPLFRLCVVYTRLHITEKNIILIFNLIMILN